jgi:hypothetical protein
MEGEVPITAASTGTSLHRASREGIFGENICQSREFDHDDQRHERENLSRNVDANSGNGHMEFSSSSQCWFASLIIMKCWRRSCARGSPSHCLRIQVRFEGGQGSALDVTMT